MTPRHEVIIQEIRESGKGWTPYAEGRIAQAEGFSWEKNPYVTSPMLYNKRAPDDWWDGWDYEANFDTNPINILFWKKPE